MRRRSGTTRVFSGREGGATNWLKRQTTWRGKPPASLHDGLYNRYRAAAQKRVSPSSSGQSRRKQGQCIGAQRPRGARRRALPRLAPCTREAKTRRGRAALCWFLVLGIGSSITKKANSQGIRVWGALPGPAPPRVPPAIRGDARGRRGGQRHSLYSMLPQGPQRNMASSPGPPDPFHACSRVLAAAAGLCLCVFLPAFRPSLGVGAKCGAGGRQRQQSDSNGKGPGARGLPTGGQRCRKKDTRQEANAQARIGECK